ncbi:MAG TPA: hypothetical protein VNZ56_01055 [Verrucomicrobiae bacterium]|jgi:hypothetical protein|nr:hypothetical protein [Verrucomicrobiae bacterium]
MSRIFDAIRNARESRPQKGLDVSDLLGGMELPEPGVMPREELEINLTVYGRSACEAAFYEQATAISGNANGGVFLLALPVLEGQDLLLINNSTSQEQICNVVSVRIQDIQTSEVSVSFPLPNADFWTPAAKTQNA